MAAKIPIFIKAFRKKTIPRPKFEKPLSHNNNLPKLGKYEYTYIAGLKLE